MGLKITTDPDQPVPRDVWAVLTCGHCDRVYSWITCDELSVATAARRLGWHVTDTWRDATCPRCREPQERLAL